MQIIKAERDALLRPLQIVSGVVERRGTLPILSNVLIQKDGDRVSFLGTDLEIQVRTFANIGFGSDAAQVTVSGRKCLDILKSMENADVKVTVQDRRMAIQAGKSRFAVQTLPADEFPVLKGTFDGCEPIVIEQAALKSLLARVAFAMATQDIRYYLNGALLVLGANSLTAVATDGHRLAVHTVATEVSAEERNAILPRKTVIELQRLLSDEGSVEIVFAQNQVRFTFGDIELTSKLVEGKFPDYTRVIPRQLPESVRVGREALLRSLQRASIMTSDKNKGVKLTFGENAIRIGAVNNDQEEAIEELEVEYGGSGVEFGVNVTYLIDVLSSTVASEIDFAFSDGTSSALLTMKGIEGFKYVLMPMRL